MKATRDTGEPIDYIYSDADRTATCRCCGVAIDISDAVTRDGQPYCRDAAACVWRKQGSKIAVDYYPSIEQTEKPLFGD